MKRISKELEDKMVEMYIGGATTVKIGRKYGFHATTVANRLRKRTQMRPKGNRGKAYLGRLHPFSRSVQSF